jgi:indole-3-glycerol phosphate synthase
MILDEIVAHKKRELSKAPRLQFRRMLEGSSLALICELKLKSPTHPEPFTVNPKAVLEDYKSVEVDAISVVTDQAYFGGSVDLVALARTTGLPVLRKDFILEPHQITEMKTDALLLIARILPVTKLKKLIEICMMLDIEPIVEIHGEAELEAALTSGAKVIAVNSRDLQTQKIDIESGLKLLDKIPEDRLKLFFSGISSPDDMRRVKERRANGVLIGTSILTSINRTHKIQEFKDVL